MEIEVLVKPEVYKMIKERARYAWRDSPTNEDGWYRVRFSVEVVQHLAEQSFKGESINDTIQRLLSSTH